MHVHPSGKVDVLFDKDKDTPDAKSVTVEHDKLTLSEYTIEREATLFSDATSGLRKKTTFMLRTSFDDTTLD